MAAPKLLPAFVAAFGELAAAHGDVVLSEQLVVFLVDGPWAVLRGETQAPIPRKLQPRVLIRDRLLELWRDHGSAVASAQMRLAVLSYVQVGARAAAERREAAASVERNPPTAGESPDSARSE